MPSYDVHTSRDLLTALEFIRMKIFAIAALGEHSHYTEEPGRT
jgi:hypothetical protein